MNTPTGKDLLEIGYKPGKAIGIAIALMESNYADLLKEEQLAILAQVLASPADYLEDAQLAALAEALLPPKQEEIIPLLDEARGYTIYGAAGIEAGALNQMNTAMRLPVSLAGALMPDAHQGYGLPIGGVLATKDAVIPYAVGVDIGCCMSMSLYAIDSAILNKQSEQLKRILLDNTRFGTATFKKPKDHAIMERPEFATIPIVKSLKDRAYSQLGSSGGGNHFVEFGVVELHDKDNEFGLPTGQYLAALSHSGSRGLGASIAGHYTKLAMESCRLPQEARHLAWLDLNTAEGQEYWLAMNLAGDYASACHHQIHGRLATALGEQPLAVVENHHNFAWKEKDAAGNEVIVHRKGATPAGQGVLGIIPGSMATPGFIVRGKGEANSLNSASHGAGRVMSRTKAKQTLTLPQVQLYLQEAGVEVIGSGLDEAPMVYKDIRQVMQSQQDLVEVVGTFTPKIVRMCGDEKYMEKD
ncbi:RtcB family protein [Pontibacter chinhatensis]|uniref:3'-phosphate/5'-hydroxy nucleic acid ligase n=1 Tax=Pontibacter chinhatensis TaxID=1436961 RepID=A0A1I2Z4D2_9BACT|nr:RtcB family protein [Pontibacter chinhatensis]SFH32654.1 tRNA-splicing ligase RtcB [Pontibacter chinhatensis]